MKLTRSILRPVRATRKGGAASLSFLRRHLRTSRRGGRVSTFFAITGKKKGGGFENPEPSSPKVTCIGQVRVKSKKKVKQYRREASFRMTEQFHGSGGGVQQLDDRDKVWIRQQRFSNSGAHSHRDQRWVHLPISVCEALRAFRAELCCFFPCKCSCFSGNEKERSTKSGCYADENGCGAVFARWLVAVNGGEGGKRREIEVAVGGGGDEETAEMMAIRSSRRHVFDDIEVKDDRIEVKGRSWVGEEEKEEEEARVSICIPPKNALLLMRWRSDPTKMAALANRFSLNGQAADIQEENDGDESNHFQENEEVRELFEGKDEIFVDEAEEDFEQVIAVSVEEQDIQNEAEANLEVEERENECVQQLREEELAVTNEENEQEMDEELVEEVDESNAPSFFDQENTNTEHFIESAQSGKEVTSLTEKAAVQEERKEEAEESRIVQEDEKEVKIPAPSTEFEAENPENQESAIINQEIKRENKGAGLPECLLLMMCEPKLSTEISKETWVRGADFIRLLPERPRKHAKTAATAAGDHEPVKRRPSIDSKSKPRVPVPPSKKNDQQPARSSCSLPAASMTAVAERNQVNGGACEPFVLTRCKSEPMSTAAAKLMPESCLWESNAGMKLEPHRQATLGVGAAGVGF